MVSWDERSKRTLGGESDSGRVRMVNGVGGSGGLDFEICERVRGLGGRKGSAIGEREEEVDKDAMERERGRGNESR